MKKSLFILLALSVSVFAIAQENKNVKEIGLLFNSTNSFGFTYRTGTDQSLWRFSALNLSGGNQKLNADSITTKHNDMGFGLKLGKEFRKNIAKKLDLRYGVDLSFYYDKYYSEREDQSMENYEYSDSEVTYSPGINLVLGLNYQIHKNIFIGAEILPFINYITGSESISQPYDNDLNEEKRDISGFEFGLSSSSVMLSIVYQFN